LAFTASAELGQNRAGKAARPIGVWLAFLVAVGRDRFGLCDLMRQHVAERTKLADIEFTGTHSFDLGIVACGNKNLDFVITEKISLNFIFPVSASGESCVGGMSKVTAQRWRDLARRH
jgi:hypothetical protein